MVHKNAKREWRLPESLSPIFVDFTKQNTHGNIPLTCDGTRRDLQKHGVNLVEGLTLYRYNLDENEAGERDDLFVRGTAHWHAEPGHWSAIVDDSDIRHVSTAEVG